MAQVYTTDVRPGLLAIGLLALWRVASPAAELGVSTDFPGGSAEVLRIDSDTRRIEIAPAAHFGRGWPCWWYLRVDRATPGETLTLQVRASEHPYRDKQRLSANWALPERAAISTDDIHWTQTHPGEISDKSGVYSVVAPAETFWLAWGPPFLPHDADELLDTIAARWPDAKRFTLATTRDGRAVHGIQIGGNDTPDAIWVQARQHAWESGGSWVARGFIEWVTGDSPEAIALRKSTQITFIPIMDVDSVAIGAGGKEAIPRDHNRDWSDDPHYPEVAAAQQRILTLAESGRLRMYIDLHNPGPGDERPFFYGPFNYEQLAPQKRRRYGQFLDLAATSIDGPLALHPEFRFATYVKTDEERGRMSSEWVRRHTNADTVALTLETSWNTPHSTPDGYKAVGRGLGEAIARYLHE
ncbi:MAG: hypothetical protein KDA75_00465 [Planctomycetaceae bacterium]|nr:hypothetical protein [Planctomycetaceae bacterium]